MLHKHGYGGKRSTKATTGVADYFAVLGIDSFLPPQQQNDINSDVPSSPPGNSNDDVVPNDDTNNNTEENERSSSVQTIQTNNLTSATAKTPKNSNLTSDKQQQLPIPEEETSVDNNIEVIPPSNTDGNVKAQYPTNTTNKIKMNKEEYKLHQQRFQREIIKVKLISNESDVLDERWTICNGESIPIVRDTTNTNINSNTNNNLGSVKLAYRRRGPQQQQHTTSNENEKNEDYYKPGIADIAIHYVKVRPSTIPNGYFSHLNNNNNSNMGYQQSQQELYPTQEETSLTSSSSQQQQKKTAKSLISNLAKQGAGLAVASGIGLGKGLVNVVKSKIDTSSQHDDSYHTEQDHYNNNNTSTAAMATTPLKRNQQIHSSTKATPGLYDIGIENNNSFETDFDGQNKYFQDTHGDVNLWSPRVSSPSVVGSNVGMKKKREHFFPDTPAPPTTNKGIYDKVEVGQSSDVNTNGIIHKPLHEMIPIPPSNYDEEWIIPNFCKVLELPTPELVAHRQQHQQLRQRQDPILVDRTHAISGSERSNVDSNVTSPSSVGMEAMYLSPTNDALNNNTPRGDGMNNSLNSPVMLSHTSSAPDPNYLPVLVKSIPSSTPNINNAANNDEHIYIPILAIRYQRTGESERYHEDPSIVDIHVTKLDDNGNQPKIIDEDSDEDDDEFADDFATIRNANVLLHNMVHVDILKKTPWKQSSSLSTNHNLPGRTPIILLLKHNIPNGYADIPFPSKVLDRFPSKNYRNLPFPEEELPMFCYAKGSTLVRDQLCNIGLPKAYGFVVKNERGDSIYGTCYLCIGLTSSVTYCPHTLKSQPRLLALVSCLTFMEPLTNQRKEQLDQLSMMRQDISLPHREYCLKTLSSRRRQHAGNGDIFNNNHLLVAFDDTITLENKTICLVGRYPYWTEFRRYLTHLHLLSGSSSDIPLERNISHLLLAVPIPKPGGQCVLVPFSTMNEPMAMVMPPLKDLPLVDLSYQRLFAALDVPTVVTIVLGFLCLERKVILISTRQTLLLDCCELLKSLLFPFELCCPYVPHLTHPFMSCLEFPGATFVGIHDDGQQTGLAKIVRDNIPEDSVIVELDSGEINCDGNRYETLKQAYQIIPTSRTVLIKEVEALCQDAGIVPGQEPLDYGVDSAIDSTVPSNMEMFGNQQHKQEHHEPLDDRAVRDNFLRFFCSLLGGYERFLVVPDADFVTSGNEWFDSSKFLSIASPSRKPYLSALVETQLWQSFVQRRTEASDVHCMLFDECLAEYHSSNVPYGRLSGGNTIESQESELDYTLLVDQCATEPDLLLDDEESSFLARSDVYNKSFGNDNDTSTQASSGYTESAISEMSFDKDSQFAINASGDIVTIPSTNHLPPNARYLYCVDGNPSFPTKFNHRQFLPKEPDTLTTEAAEAPPPILIRSEREREEAIRLCNSTVSRRGPQKQHRCLWQLSKFMGSQFLGVWLMCIPNQISQSNVTIPEKSKILLRALGALRTLRSHRRIVADEAAYRALIVACGRSGTDRRIELMKLYGLMRADGIFPNAVTLGQYTRAIAEGYSNMNVDSSANVGMQISVDKNTSKQEGRIDINILDNNLSILEESGLKWRSRGNNNGDNTEPIVQPGLNAASAHADSKDDDQSRTISPSKTFDTATTHRSIKTKRTWLPIRCSSSFCPGSNEAGNNANSTRLFALWSRATSCKSCSYIPLDEEIMGGWDVLQNKDTPTTIVCPRCEGSITPLIGFEELDIAELLESEASVGTSTSTHQTTTDLDVSGVTQDGEQQGIPPQLGSTIKYGHGAKGQSGFVTYLSPQKLRMMLEELVLEYGEEVLDRDRLRELNPEVFFNFWWYSARFSLPLPLAVTPLFNDEGEELAPATDCCAFASWDKTLALQGCQSAAKAIMAAQTLRSKSDRVLHEKLYENPNTDIPLLSFFNLQSYAQCDWDNPLFSELLVALVKACETRDLLPVVECMYQRNQTQDTSFTDASFESVGVVNSSFGALTESSARSPPAGELDCYRTILYLARYQCTTAFHAFFPTTIRACKGYHFWCAQGTSPYPIFDRAFREAAESYSKQQKLQVPISSLSPVALGFRSVFGHVI